MDLTAAQRTAAHLRTYLWWHAAAAMLVFLLWFALWVEILVPSFGPLVSLLAGLPMLYPLVAAFLLFKARQRLVQRQVDASRWIRWSMGLALPGSLAVGVGSVLFTIMGILNGDIASTLLLFVPFVLIGLSSAFVLMRVLFKTDLDELLWAEADQPLDDALTFMEGDEVEVEFDLGVAEQADEGEDAVNRTSSAKVL